MRRAVRLSVFALLLINLAIVGKLFFVEYSAYTGSIEGTFIALPRIMAKYPLEWTWWPFWNGGLPFENAYLPFSHWLVAAFTLLAGLSAARSFHIVTAAALALTPLALFWMAYEFSRKLVPSFIAALACSCVSLSALLIPAIGSDVGGVWNLRRLHVLGFYGESPHTVALALVPVTMVLFARALTRPETKWKILAGLGAAAVVLSNAFGSVVLVAGLASWLLAMGPTVRRAVQISAIGLVTFCWVTPWLSPSMIRAIRDNSPTAGGDFRYTHSTGIALAIFLGGYLLLWLLMRSAGTPVYLRFFALFAYLPSGFTFVWYFWGVPVVPQPARYQLELDLLLVLPLVFGAAAMLERVGRRVRTPAAVTAIAVLAACSIHSVIYARGFIRSVDSASLSEYKIAKWLDQNRPGERSYISGSGSLLFNVFTDNPQLHGGHDQHTLNSFIPIVDFTIASGMNAGDRDAEYSMFWMQAFGVRNVVVSGAGSTDWYKAIAHPHKFDGVLPLLWREGGDAIYEVPVRSPSLAHVIPGTAVVPRRPVHGLDIAGVEPFVNALEDPRYPPAEFRWVSMSEAAIRATLEPGQVVAVQVSYARGWEATAKGKRQPIRTDAIGQLVIAPDCTGPCAIDLRYTGGVERTITRTLSLVAMLIAAAYVWLGRGRKAGARE